MNILERLISGYPSGDVAPQDFIDHLTIGKMKAYVAQEGLSIAIGDKRLHHEIYLSDPRKTAADKLKTVIRYPVK